MKKSRTQLARMFAAAVCLALPAMSLAQGQIDTSRGNDASNRVGSGGRNYGQTDINRYSNYMVNNGNRIVNGTVSNGREFRGNVPYSDQYQFRGSTGGTLSDNFTRDSTGVPQAYTAAPVPNQSNPYYGTSGTVQAPPGYTMSPGRNGYVPPAPTTARGTYDQRVGVVDLNQPMAPVPVAGEMFGRGSLTPNQNGQGTSTVITSSSLYGMREWNPADPIDRMFLENMARRQMNGQEGSTMDPREVQRIRMQVEDILKQEGVKPTDMVPNKPLDKTLESASDAKVSGGPINGQLNGNADSEIGFRQKLIGIHQKSNTQYAELNKRLELYYGERKKTDADFTREFNAAMKVKKEAEEKARLDKNKANPLIPGGDKNTTPDKNAIPGKNPNDIANDNMPRIKKPTPLKVNSIATGVKAAGLADVLKKAESLMKEGKYASALDQYDSAELVTPSNPLIWLGRANAELGAGFFSRADSHIKQAFMSDKSLMMGQYDLLAMMGEERMNTVVKDLKEIANKDQKPASVFLLAYIFYNTGHEKQAMGFLDLAQKRSGENDMFFKMLREHWSLPEERVGGKPDAPKVDVPKMDMPKIDAPKVDAPKIDTPKIDVPKLNSSKVEIPKVETPKVDVPKVDVPKSDTPKPDLNK